MTPERGEDERWTIQEIRSSEGGYQRYVDGPGFEGSITVVPESRALEAERATQAERIRYEAELQQMRERAEAAEQALAAERTRAEALAGALDRLERAGTELDDTSPREAWADLSAALVEARQVLTHYKEQG